ncbi:hypothetical protein [Cupriavidus sp. UYPR2.512]|uniref:hypothetical protein n=1 Tax=Cupriavidus sp. UYPR2.512 TaxID=1080187 RepID=UPI000376A426|nr:hypothetical protein [Cupriavidus sp. UYPR2.512]UIF85154.1 hypothetical protein KAF44_13400 [Cupriavidus necator]
MNNNETMKEIASLLDDLLVKPAARLQRRRRASSRRVRVALVDDMLREMTDELEQRLAGKESRHG